MDYDVYEQGIHLRRSIKLSAKLSMSNHNMRMEPSRGSLYLQYMKRSRGLIRV